MYIYAVAAKASYAAIFAKAPGLRPSRYAQAAHIWREEPDRVCFQNHIQAAVFDSQLIPLETMADPSGLRADFVRNKDVITPIDPPLDLSEDELEKDEPQKGEPQKAEPEKDEIVSSPTMKHTWVFCSPQM
jgi:hypothetical protein